MAEVSMFTRVLIANRGEIALRILRTCHEMGIETVAAYTKVDEDLLHLKYATDIVCIDQTSYLNGEAMVVAERTSPAMQSTPVTAFSPRMRNLLPWLSKSQ